VDVVGGVGYNSAHWPEGANRGHVDLRLIVTDLCVLDFSGAQHAIRLRSLHPGVSLESVQAATGFPLEVPTELAVTSVPSEQQLSLIRGLDPHGLRAGVLKGNPPGTAPRAS
jgi:glutaconate CoA-transferase, subunit B